MNPKSRIVSCPTCATQVSWTPDNVWRPFCSERCRIIDLGEWAKEKYRVPAVEEKDDPEQAAPGDLKF